MKTRTPHPEIDADRKRFRDVITAPWVRLPPGSHAVTLSDKGTNLLPGTHADRKLPHLIGIDEVLSDA